ncbi:MAG: MFS transporter [Verrucomicrobia bacterium]|nr:MFS transporter [Verrucomicrobiota bacterium]
MRQLCAFYFVVCAAAGILLPFFNLHLKQLGFSDWQIGIVAALAPLGRVVFPGFWGALADRSRRRNLLLAASCACMALAFGGVLTAKTFAWMIVAVTTVQFFSTLTGPLVDASTLEIARREGFDYGQVRAWGSIGFVVAAMVVGKLLDSFPTLAGLAAAALCYVVMAGIALRLPPLPVSPPKPEGERARRRDVLRQPLVAALLAASLLNQLAHGVYYNFFTIHLREVGYTPFTIAFFWSFAVAAEVWFIFKSGALIRRFGAVPLIVISLVAGALRWGAYALSASWWVLLLMQPLHALTFGAFQMSAMHIIHDRFPEELRVSGQSYLTIASWGAGSLIGALVAGWAMHAIGASGSYALCAAVALAGAGLALAGLRGRR